MPTQTEDHIEVGTSVAAIDSWEYRVIRWVFLQNTSKQHVQFTVHEVYLGADGEVLGWIEKPAFPMGETMLELARDIDYFIEAHRKPVIEATDLPLGLK